MESARTRSIAVVARGLCAGALGGAVAGACDFLLARGGAAEQFLPDGTARLAGFLIAFYGGFGALAGAGLGALAAFLAWGTDLGALLENAFCDPAAAEARRAGTAPPSTLPSTEGGRVLAYLVALAGGLALHGAMVYGVTLTALYRFHGHLLIAALVAAAAVGLALPSLLVVAVVARALSPLLGVGPRVRVRLVAAPGWVAAFATLGLAAAGAAAMALVDRIQLRPRMTPPLRALNAALWTPVLVASALVLATVVARFTWRRIAIVRRVRGLERPAGAVAFSGILVAVAAALAIALSWPVATLLPWKAFVAAAAGAVAATVAALAGAGARFDGRRWKARALGVLLVPVSLLAIGLGLGQSERVHKAAIAHAGLATPLISVVRAASDFDRDGYSSLFGSDCDDWNADIHPGAFDWPDDGIDQDCNGHQATAQPRARAPFAPLPPSVPKQPNVILITIDAVRADHVGAYGYARPTTPRLDAFASEATLFQNGWAHSPSTRYSVPAILTGRYESTIAWGPPPPAGHWPPAVLPQNRLLAEMFKERGYRTGAFLPYHYFEREWGLDQGFDDYDYSLSRLHGNPFNGDPARTTGSSSTELADLGIGYIERYKDRPFFLWMHFYDPHYLYEKHPGYPSFGESELDLYDGELVFTDHHVGRVFDALKAAGLWERSIVIVTSDHGEGLGEHGIHQHGYHIYAQQTKVPFIVRVPGIAPRTVADPVGHVDLFPSLLNLLGGRDEPQLLGSSFVAAMTATGTPDAERLVFGEVEYEGPVVRKSVASRDWHLIDNVVPDHTFELYHLTVDAAEAHDRSGLGEPEEQRLRRALAAWMDETAATHLVGRVSQTALPFGTAIGADVGGMITVDGVDVRSATVAPGGEAAVDLVMHATHPVPPGWWLFVHLTAADGRFLNADPPRDGFIPLTKVKPGQYIALPIRVAVPPAWPSGPLTVELGLYRGGERATVTSPSGVGNHVVAATVQVVR